MSLMEQAQAVRAATVNSTRLVFKAVVVGGLTLVILLALLFIGNTISERQAYREEAVKSIAESYASGQTLIGPVLVRPFTVNSKISKVDDKGKPIVVNGTREGVAWSFPQELNVNGALKTTERRHGLYRVPVYELDSRLTGSVQVEDATLQEGEKTADVVYGAPYFAVAVSDVRGIVGTPKMTVNDAPVAMLQGVPQRASWGPNLRAPLAVAGKDLHGKLSFSLDLVLAGTEHLSVAPVGNSNHIEMHSAWPSPLFAGRFLPREYTVGKTGFKASWDISSLASATQQQMVSGGDKGLDTIRVDLITSIDPYKLSDRAVKYGILFVMITFGGFFLFETVKKIRIHPVQYFLVGLGLAIFFLLLISLSEHVAFGFAYAMASAACIGLLTFYLTYVLRSAGYGLGFGVLLTALYGAIYGLLVSEDNALLLGAVLLFGLLAAAMVLTRKVDWYGEGAAG